ncbi:YceI family protein [Streptomyces canus]|uniref:YceI family protein n=1 Tax=Streptomyces canus TaxID=58343 RepID=UPI002257513B|nr:YceI family protein [Streptomyces canus]MCX5256656.1 YceI family protein [Streptomyces canus]
MTTVTLPTVPPPQRHTVAPGRSLTELTAWYGPLPLRRRRIPLAEASMEMSPDAEQPAFSFSFDDRELRAVLTSEQVDALPGDRLQLTGDLTLNGVAFPVLLRLRVVERAEDRLLVVGAAKLPYRLLRRATGFRLPWRIPATRLRLLVAAEFA